MSDSSGILEELRAERQELERMIKVAKNIMKEEVVLSSAPFFSLEEKEGKLLITGIALAEGVWKNVLYPAEEIEKSATNLIGKPLLIEHGLDEKFERTAVGKVKLAYYDKALKSIVFQAEVTDPTAIVLVKDGTFPAVSCSTWVDKFPVNPDQSIGFNFNFNELSLVRTPACEKCFIFAVEELSKKVSQEKQSLNQSTQITETEVNKMKEEEKEEVIEELEEDTDLSEMEKPKLYAVVEVNALTDFDETLSKKMISYYYGYNYPYGYKGKYPYPGYPYYPYYPANQAKDKKYYEYYPYKKPEKKSLWALLELESPEEIETLKAQGKKVKAVYYGYYGYPHKGYPYKEKKSEEYKCPEGQVWDEKSGKCIEELAKKEYKCPEGQVWDEKTSKCIEAPKEEMAKTEEYKCPEGQVWDEKEKKCVEAKEEMSDAEELLEDLAIPKDYLAFMKKCMKESKTMPVIKRMKACAKAWKAEKPEEKAKEEYKCPEGQMWDEKEKKCIPIEKKENYPAPEQKSSTEFTDMEPGPMETPPAGFDEQAKKLVKLSAETVKKEEVPTIPKVESPVTEEPCKDCPKKEEASIPKAPEPAVVPTVPVIPKVEEVKPVEPPKAEEPKVEVPKEPEKPKEEPKVEPPKVEPPKEEPKVETPKVEIPKVEEKPVEKPAEVKPEEPVKEEAPEEKKEPTEAEVKAYVKGHWEELMIKLHKEKKFP